MGGILKSQSDSLISLHEMGYEDGQEARMAGQPLLGYAIRDPEYVAGWIAGWMREDMTLRADPRNDDVSGMGYDMREMILGSGHHIPAFYYGKVVGNLALFTVVADSTAYRGYIVMRITPEPITGTWPVDASHVYQELVASLLRIPAVL